MDDVDGCDGVGWAIVLFYAVCCALRLARFNTEAGNERPAYASPFFTGVPAPAGAGLVMVPMFLSFEWGDWLFRSPYLSALIVDRHRRVDGQQGADRVAEADPHPPSPGGADTARHRRPGGLCHDRAMADLTAIGIVYVGSIPLTIRAYFRLKPRRRTPAATNPPTPLPLPPPPAAAYPLGDGGAPANQWRH